MKKALMAAALFAAVTSASAATVSVLKASTVDGTPADKDYDVTRFGVSVGYDYVLSKRTQLYANYGFAQQNQEKTSDDTVKRNRGMEFTAGMVHYF